MRTLACVSAAVALALTATAHAQSTPPGQAKKQKAPNQTADHGTGDASELTVADSELLQRLFGKNEGAIIQTTLANGGVRIELDESFEEAMTVTVAGDGSLRFGHFTGIENAARAVKAAADAKKPETKNPAATLEEK